MNIEYPYLEIAKKDGVLGTVWGPCLGGVPPGPCPCPPCRFSDELELRGLDYVDEWMKFEAGNETLTDEIIKFLEAPDEGD